MDDIDSATYRDPELIGARVPFETLPVIDIGALVAGGTGNKKKAAQELFSAAHDIGFFYVAGHNVSQSLIDDAFELSRQFFSLSFERKMEFHNSKGINRTGYVKMGEQITDDLASAAEVETDLVEGIDVAFELKPGDPDWGFPYYGPNLFPTQPAGFDRLLADYYDTMLGVGHAIMRGFAISLDLDEHFFDRITTKPLAYMAVRHYPPQRGPITAKQLGSGTHTDYGCVTMIAQEDGIQALQALNSAGKWIEIPPRRGMFTCNLGEALERWSNGRLAATKHRVINDSGKDRVSIPFFFNPNRDVQVEVLKSCIGPDNPLRYKPFAFGEYYLKRMRYVY
jgi:isopenicillin N synthase-like dioxygenase